MKVLSLPSPVKGCQEVVVYFLCLGRNIAYALRLTTDPVLARDGCVTMYVAYAYGLDDVRAVYI